MDDFIKKEEKNYRAIRMEDTLWDGCEELARRLTLEQGRTFHRSEIIRTAVKVLLKKTKILES